jgi:hypothetical protein
MRIVSFMAISLFAVASPAAWAEDAPAEPPKAEAPATPTTSATPEKFTESIQPVTQSKVPKPRESGLYQQLCTGE